MRIIWTEQCIREEIRRLDQMIGLDGASLPISFSQAQHTLGMLSTTPMRFTFSNVWSQNPDWIKDSSLDTIRHEYAHYMDWELYRHSGHRASWKHCCTRIGALPVHLYSNRIEQLNRARNRSEAERIQNAERYTVGQRLIHPQFGKGSIVSVEGEGISRVLVMRFNRIGEKRLMTEWVDKNCKAPLT